MIEEEEREKIKKDLISLREELTKKLVDEIAEKRQQVAKEKIVQKEAQPSSRPPVSVKQSIPKKKIIPRFYGRRLQRK